MKENQLIARLEVCSDFVHTAAMKRAATLDDGDGVVIVPITVCLLVRVERDGAGTVMGSTVRVPVGAPADKMAEVLTRSAEAVAQIGDNTEMEGTHHFQVKPGGQVEPLEEESEGKKYDA